MKLAKHTAILSMLSALASSVAFAAPAFSTKAGVTAGTPSQSITRGGSQPATQGPVAYLTGNVSVALLFNENQSAPYAGASVTFEAGARSAWHIHPYGQRLVVTAGEGRTAQWGGSVQEFKAGDVLWCPPGVKHWHGASPGTAMTHLALTGTVNRKNVVWLERVTGAQHHAGTATMNATKNTVRNTAQNLTAKQRGIIPIAAFTATGEQEKLKMALADGLAAGLTVNEIKEILVQMYAYAGFPRSLSGIQTFMTLMEERQVGGIRDEVGKEATPLPAGLNRDEYGAQVRAVLAGQEAIPPPAGYQMFTPVIDTFLKEHLFADIFARDVLDHQSRELATISALAAMTGTRSQLQLHLSAAMNVGLTEPQLRAFIATLEARVGQKESASAEEVLAAVLESRK